MVSASCITMEVLHNCGRCWSILLVFLCAFSVALTSAESVISIPMPKPPPGGPKHNDYMCTGVPVREDGFVVRYEPRADPRVAHHMLMFGCGNEMKSSETSWPCKSNMQICRGGNPKILYAWALNASGLQLPSDVGMQIGPSVYVRTLVMQVHYGHPETVPDLDATSKQALLLHTTKERQPYVAGIYLLGSVSPIRSGQEKVLVDSGCQFPGPKAIFPFAFRTHAHSLGEQIVGYIVKPNGEWELIGTRSPQDAQAFYPAANPSLEVDKGDWLAVRCVFNTKGKTHSVQMGPDSEDEMCNYYIMYYTANNGRDLLGSSCWSHPPRSLHFPDQLPPLPAITSPVEEEHDHHHHMGNEGDSHMDGGHKESDDDHMDGGHKESEDDHMDGNHKDSEDDHMDGGHKEGEDDHMDGGNKGSENEGGNKEDDDEYLCPKSVPPGEPSVCTKPTPIPTPPPQTTPKQEPSSKPFFEGDKNTSPIDLGLVQAEDWALNEVSIPGRTLGQVSAVAVDKEGNVHILHRGPVVWDFMSFNRDKTYRHIKQGPIHEPTLLQFTSTGGPLFAWGEDMFYMPHGLTIDHQGAFWVTDVALHQIFKFSKIGDTTPDMILGTSFKPGVDFGHFCQPASVAVEESGVFYVADGYCNKRIVKFDAVGNLIKIWDSPVASLHLFIPHKASLSKDQTTLYVADRENKRIISYNTQTGSSQLFSGPFRDSVYAVSMNGSHDWPMYGVFGGGQSTLGFTLDKSGDLVTTWGPKDGFARPHDLTVDPVHNAVYVTEIGPNRIWKFVPLAANSAVPVPSEESPTTKTSPTSAPVTNSHVSVPHTSPPPSSSPHTESVPPSTPLNDHDLNDQTGSAESENSDHHDNDNSTAESANAGHHDNTDTVHANGVPSDAVLKRATFNIGIFVAIFVVVIVILIIIFGILREHRYLKKLSLYVRSRRKPMGGVDGGGVSVETKGRKLSPKSLQSLLGPSRPGFSRLKTYDSDSEAEEFPVFNRV